jgi:hypothetical protein
MEPNPVEVRVPEPWDGVVQCQANASYYQRVTLTINGQQVAFGGTGEGQPMSLPDGRTTYPLGSTRGDQRIPCLFEFSPSGPNGPFSDAAVLAPTYVETPNGIFIQVQSEDSVDNDYNDSVLTFVPNAHQA